MLNDVVEQSFAHVLAFPIDDEQAHQLIKKANISLKSLVSQARQDVLIPEENEKDLVEIPLEVKKGLKIKAVKNVKESLGLALETHPNFLKDQQKVVPDISWTENADVQHPA